LSDIKIILIMNLVIMNVDKILDHGSIGSGLA